MKIAAMLNVSHASIARLPCQPVRESETAVLQDYVQHVLPSLGSTVVGVLPLARDSHLTYLVRLSDGTGLILKSGPLTSTRTMRREQHRLENESRALTSIERRTNLPVPRRVKPTSRSRDDVLMPALLLQTYLPGMLLSDLWPSLSRASREHLNRTLGLYFLALTSITADSFGTPHDVHKGRGSRTWREAFLTMLEATLRDAEDMLISIPYDSVRSLVAANAAVLDAVTTPRLTALEACLPHSVLVDRDTLQVTGLLGFGNVVWGDPDMAAVLAEPDAAFMNSCGRASHVQDQRPRRTRRLMYGVYRSLVAVVRHHYRPRRGEDDIEPRRALARNLNELAAL